MNQLILNIKNDLLLEKIVQLLEVFRNDGVEIKEILKSTQNNWSNEYIEKNWREIGMSTHSADLDDNEIKYEAYTRFQNEKYSS